jgi:hypothetical protein
MAERQYETTKPPGESTDPPDQDSALPGIVFGLLNSIEDEKPKPPPTESAIVKTMAMVLEKIARPFIYLFYWNEHIPLSYGRMRQIWIIAVMLVIPLILFCVNYFHISKKIKESLTNESESDYKIPAEISNVDLNFKVPELLPDLDLNFTSPEFVNNMEFNDTKPSPPNRQDVTMIYMTCIWMSMFVLFVFFFPRLQHMAK